MYKVAHHPQFVLPLPEGHRFPMEKYSLLPQQLLYEGTLEPTDFFEPELPDDQYILAVHQKTYIDALNTLTLGRKAIRKIGFPLTEALVERERLIAGGTIQSALYALEDGVSFTTAGGTHHAFTDHGEGFCIYHDQAIASRYLQRHGLAKQILIVDLDVHQGNGTAEIFEGDDSVFTFSMHGAKNYPFRKEKSDLDIELPDQTSDKFYLETLQETLPKLIESIKPNFIFYQSGVDILATDKLGRLGCTHQGVKERDRFVFETAQKNEISIQCSMGGGYSPQIRDIIEAHTNTYRVAKEIFF